VFYNRYNTGKPALVIVGGAIGGAMFFAGAQRYMTAYLEANPRPVIPRNLRLL